MPADARAHLHFARALGARHRLEADRHLARRHLHDGHRHRRRRGVLGGFLFLLLRAAVGAGGQHGGEEHDEKLHDWMSLEKQVDDARGARGLAFGARRNGEQPLQAVVAGEHGEQHLRGELGIRARSSFCLQELGQPAHHLARGVRVHVARERAEARHLGHQGAEGGDALRAERALAVFEREAQQAARARRSPSSSTSTRLARSPATALNSSSLLAKCW